MKPGMNVPAKPVIWKATFKDQTRLITARLWFDAIQQAVIKFGCSPDELTVERL